MPTPARKRNRPSCQTFCASAAAAGEHGIAGHRRGQRARAAPAIRERTPEERGTPAHRKTANSTEPANTTCGADAGSPDFGSSSVSAGVSTSAKMNESMPSSVHPAHAAQKPRRWALVSASGTAGCGKLGALIIIPAGGYLRARSVRCRRPRLSAQRRAPRSWRAMRPCAPCPSCYAAARPRR